MPEGGTCALPSAMWIFTFSARGFEYPPWCSPTSAAPCWGVLRSLLNSCSFPAGRVSRWGAAPRQGAVIDRSEVTPVGRGENTIMGGQPRKTELDGATEEPVPSLDRNPGGAQPGRPFFCPKCTFQKWSWDRASAPRRGWGQQLSAPSPWIHPAQGRAPGPVTEHLPARLRLRLRRACRGPRTCASAFTPGSKLSVTAPGVCPTCPKPGVGSFAPGTVRAILTSTQVHVQMCSFHTHFGSYSAALAGVRGGPLPLCLKQGVEETHSRGLPTRKHSR